ncbi:MAG: sigma-54-dependent Fis family transcriptional regulator [Proteobacteria bacterium]|nr:sigma-54-dependent Fis family transcriptional regulator [Pseudomonadota bacterium]
MALTTGTLLVVDDNSDVLTAARLALAPHFEKVVTLQHPERSSGALGACVPDAILLDMNFAPGERTGREGLDWLRQFRQSLPTASVVLMTAFGGVSLAVEALKNGAVDFVLKPWQNDKLVATMSAAVALSQARSQATALRARNNILIAESAPPKGELIGSAAALRQVFDIIARAAPTDANVLILGESGTGKELTAREIHRLSRRAREPFVSVDLGALPDSLFESELFGHKRGAFTGADSDRAGRIAAANGGTLFLDEIGNLPLHLQRKLLTVLERREVVAIGAANPTPIDIRLISATNRSAIDLEDDEVLRQDLLFRIRTVEITLPPLRLRVADIPALLEHFLTIYARKYDVPRRKISADALALLEKYPWPGNVRELRHAVERATILANSDRLIPEDFPFAQQRPVTTGPPAEDLDLERTEKRTIERALRLYDGNISQAANALGLTRPALYRRMTKHQL